MSGDGSPEERSAEERAEELMERTVHGIRRLVARAREEVEDIVAEAQAIHRGDKPAD